MIPQVIRSVVISAALAALLAGCGREVFTGKREARGVWMSRFEYASAEMQGRPELGQARIRDVFDKAHKARFNMIFFQIRGNGDAFYVSQLEPWSDMLTGTLGIDPGWDPLQYAIDLAHSRGMELHVWINTFPIWRGKEPPPETTPRHPYLDHPEWVVADSAGIPMPLSEHYISVSPGIPEARGHIIRVVLDIVDRYDVDGVHFDYIRYPEEAGSHGYSHDSISVARFNSVEGNSLKLAWDDWQREQINQFVADVYNAVTERKPWVKLSAAVIGKYSGSGWTAYDAVYQDPRRWMELGKIDFIAPMVYWERAHATHPFVPLVHEWADRVAYDRYVLPGLLTGLQRRHGWDELRAQVEETRKKGLPGVVYFSAGGLTEAWDAFAVREFPYWSLVPRMPWKDSTAPPPPSDLAVETEGSARILHWEAPPVEEPLIFVIYRGGKEPLDFQDAHAILAITGRNETSWRDEESPSGSLSYAVTAVDRLGNESPPAGPVKAEGSPLASERGR